MVSGEERAEKTRKLAAALFPWEEWVQVEERIFVANSRPRHTAVFAKELIQARILAARASTVYFLPEYTNNEGKKSADAVVDGLVMEFKTVTGALNKVERHFRYSRKQGKNVFLKVDNPELSRDMIQENIAKTLQDSSYTGGTDGLVIVHITEAEKTYYWTLQDIKNPASP